MTTGIQYIAPTNEEYRGRVQGYHSSARFGFKDLSKGAKSNDIAQLKSVDRSNLTNVAGDFNSKFTIGFEVEKSRFGRGAVKPTALFAGFERDSSCGYEAVTNILPLVPASQWRNKVFNMMHESKRIIEDTYSPSSYKCGGHTTIAVEGMTGEELMSKLRLNMGIVMALFRKRLTNGYCNGNTLMNNDGYGRYQMVLVKSNVVEVRLVSRFQSVKQMMRRYELFYELLNFSVNNPNGSHASLLKRLKPIVKSMYANDMEKVNEVMDLAKHFRKYIQTGKVNRGVINFIDPMRRMDAQSRYDRDLLTNGYR